MEEGNISGANSSEKASEEVNGESDRRQAGETVLNERCGEEGAVSEAQEADIDDPQEGTSASTVRPRSAERSGRTKERGKVGRVRRPWGEMEQSNERGKDGKGDGCTPAKEVCGPAMETIGLSSSVEADTAVAEEGAEVIQTIRAVDKDDFANGRFSFTLPSDLPVNPNFTLKDNEDNSATIVARRRRFSSSSQELYRLAVVVSDGGEPALSSTSTLTLRVCACGHGRLARTCQARAFLSAAGLSTGALIAILLCIVILLAIVVLFINLRSKKAKKEPLVISEEDVRENVVTYDDEGGGEEDTEAFDIAALRNPAVAEENKHRRDVRPDGRRAAAAGRQGNWSPSRALDDADVQAIIRRRLVEADLDGSVPPYDSLQTYAYEGRGSPTGSVSSLDSADGLSERDYNDADDWGPAFHKLAELLGEVEPEASA
ncbi:hypothetical protein SKAU_G00382140 [Synaphobranchus kaupii]|uniref:Cadherin domain-containing protein n=1 Tax=Synaphobranchus kaupii TaxID=118154 RepID=A0A9Q1EDW5_SYNKA|nr:hypothetical protein SKAU_G00382140 [Synaphobranchus kaupii]